MSKDRRRRRSAREAAVATTRPQRSVRPAPRPTAATSRGRVGRTLLGRPRGRSRRGRSTGPLAAQRRTQNTVLAAGLVLANLLLWTQVDGWLARLVALVVTVALWPVVVTVVFDRRSS